MSTTTNEQALAVEPAFQLRGTSLVLSPVVGTVAATLEASTCKITDLPAGSLPGAVLSALPKRGSARAKMPVGELRLSGDGSTPGTPSFAVVLSQDDQATEACLLATGPQDEKLPLEYCLDEMPLFRRLVRSTSVHKAIKLAVLATFVAIISGCLAFADQAAGSISNALIWGVWEPALILSFLLFGHLWCAICPLSTMGRGIQRHLCYKKQPSAWLKKWSVWLATLGYFAIIWSERVFHMIDNPFSSGILLLTLFLAAITFCIVFRREVWCRYVCPLGFLASCHSLPAMLHVRAKPDVCSTFCRTGPCYKGSDGEPGCPMSHHPLNVSKSYNCKLCLNCVRTCPHDSVGLYLRPILQSVWVIRNQSKALIPFSLVAFCLSLIVFSSQKLPLLSDPSWFTAVAGSSFLLAALLYYLLDKYLLYEKESQASAVARISATLLVLSWGPFMAYQIGNVPGLASLSVQVAPGTPMQFNFPWLEVGVLALLQLSVIVAAAILAAVSLWRIRTCSLAEEGGTLNPGAWHLLEAFCACYAMVAVAMVFA